MTTFNNNFTDELRARLSIVDIVGRRVPLNKKGQNYWGCCPFHGEKTPSFSVNEDKGFYHCFGCGEHGDIISFTMKINNIDFKSAITDLAQIAGLQMPDYKPKSPAQIEREQGYFEIYEGVCKIYQEKLFDAVGADALKYLRGRGFDDEKIKKYRIGYAPRGNVVVQKFASNKNITSTALIRNSETDGSHYDFFRDRLMFPIFNPGGQIIAFSGRSMDGSEPKYINTSDTDFFHKRQTLFGLNFARDAIHRANRSIVVEGQIDTIQMQTNGFGETVAPLGTALTTDHLQILCKSNRNIIFCFDGDGAGQKAAARAMDLIMPLLRDNSDVRFAFVTGGKDPDEILKSKDSGQKNMKNIIDSAIPVSDFLWQIGNTNFSAKTDFGQATAHKFMMAEIDKITDESRCAAMRQYIKDKEWNEWHKNSKNLTVEKIAVPKIDLITKKTLSEISETYPQLIEKYSEFLQMLNIDLGAHLSAPTACKISEKDSEKFIIALKLNFYMNELKQKLKTVKSSEEIQKLNREIIKTAENINKISEL